MNEIHQTTEYSKFKSFKSNRPTLIANLLESIKEKNMLSSHPILVTKNFGVIDGGHRLACAKELKIPIFYIIDPLATELDIPICQVQRPWTQEDFLRYYAEHLKEYSIFKRFYDQYNFPMSFLIKSLGSGKDASSQFKKGDLKLRFPIETIDLHLSQLDEICRIMAKIYGKQTVRHNVFYAVISIIRNDGYSHKHFLKKIAIYPDNVKEAIHYYDETNIRSMLLQKVYLYRMRKN